MTTANLAIMEQIPTSSMGDLNAWIEKDYPLLKHKALQIIGQQSDLFESATLEDAACTLIHEAFPEANQHFEQFDSACGTFVNWYSMFMQNAFRRMQRKQPRLTLVRGYPEECDLFSSRSSFDDLDRNLIERETANSFISCVNCMDRQLLFLYYWKDMPGPRIAQMLPGSLNCFHSRLHRILRYFRRIAPEIMQDNANNTRKMRRPTRRRVASPRQLLTSTVIGDTSSGVAGALCESAPGYSHLEDSCILSPA
jgi:DNA-directed RNA polymerase specialized sigma24 family protein